MKRKDKPSERKNAKRMNLVQLDGWGEHPVIEPSDGIRQWLLRSSQEEQQDHSWPQVTSQGASKRMKQLELSFSKILDLDTGSESEDEHVRRMEEQPDKLHEEPESVSSPYVKKTGKLTKKEIREQSTKNKSILDWARRDDDTTDIPKKKRILFHMDGVGPGICQRR